MQKIFPSLKVLSIPDFKNFIIGKFLLSFAIRTMHIILGWLIYSHTHNEFHLGLVGLSEAIPFIILTLYGGHVADITSRRKIVVVCTIIYMFIASLQLLFTHHFEYVYSNYGLLPFWLLIGFAGITRAFYAPANGALVAQVVPREMFVYSATLNSLAYDMGSICGPAIAGILYAYYGHDTAFLFLFIMVCCSVFFMSRISHIPLPPKPTHENIWDSLKQGLQFVFKTQQLIGAFALDMFAVLFGGAIAMLPAYADKVLHCGPKGLGYLQSAMAIGAVVMSIILSSRPVRKNAGKKLFLSIGIFGICILVFALSKNYILSFVMLMLAGAFDEISVIIRTTIVQMYSPENMRGRIEAVSKIFIGSSNELGAFESGTAARAVGLVPSVVAGACVTLAVVATCFKFMPKIRNLQFEQQQ
jgi:MFS family permease